METATIENLPNNKQAIFFICILRPFPIILISENENVKLQDCSHVAFPSIFCQSAPLSDIHFHRV